MKFRVIPILVLLGVVFCLFLMMLVPKGCEFTERLDSSPEMAAKIERWKEELLATETVKRFSSSLWWWESSTC